MSWISDVKYELNKLDNSKKKLRNFGVVVGFVTLLLTFWLFNYKIFTIYNIFFYSLGFSLVTFGLFSPKKLSLLYKIWMGIAFALGWIVSRFLLTIIFFIILTPIAIIAKIFNKQFLMLKFDKQKETYWRKKVNKINYQKMF